MNALNAHTNRRPRNAVGRWLTGMRVLCALIAAVAHGKVADALRNGGCAYIFHWETLEAQIDDRGYTGLDGKLKMGVGTRSAWPQFMVRRGWVSAGLRSREHTCSLPLVAASGALFA